MKIAQASIPEYVSKNPVIEVRHGEVAQDQTYVEGGTDKHLPNVTNTSSKTRFFEN